MNKTKKYIAIFLAILSFPSSCLAYSNKIILGGQNIGINIQNKGVIVIGYYKIKDKYINKHLQEGDTIIKINNKDINSITDLTNELGNYNSNIISVTYIRDNKEYESTLDLINDNNTLKTGLYVKDNIKGIGTLSYIDPETKIYGSLGHVIESSNTKINVNNGYVFRSSITNIDRSYDGNPGEKNAKFYNTDVLGTINKNTIYGIFGIYNKELNKENIIDVGYEDDIKLGKAKIYTVIHDEEVEEFEINITNINKSSKLKNISYEITDERLLSKTGGIVQGMSGSPIVQNGKIIGVVTHVIIDDVKKGYGLFITTMLEEGEK